MPEASSGRERRAAPFGRAGRVARGLAPALLLLVAPALAQTAAIQPTAPAQATSDECPDGYRNEKIDPRAPGNIQILRLNLRYYWCTDYKKDVARVVDEARAFIAERVPRVDKPAVVLDIDETSLSNWQQIVHNGFGYFPSGACDLKSTSPCGQREWELSSAASAIEPTLALYRTIRTLRGKNGEEVAIFFVTGRNDDALERLATEFNLHKVGYDDWKRLVMRSDLDPGRNVSVYKTAARERIEADGFRIVANLGDQLSDLVGGHAERCFKIPNPFYFIDGEPVPETGLDCLTR